MKEKELQVKFRCNSCYRQYYVPLADAQLFMPDGIQEGDAFLDTCPLCEEECFVVLVDRD